MDTITHHSSDPAIVAIGISFIRPHSSAPGRRLQRYAESFRHSLWNAAMNGQYISANTDPSAARGDMKAFYEFFAKTRHWELEPYFDVDGGRALALEDVEYIVYVEKPGPVEITIEKHGYDVAWFNPVSGDHRDERFQRRGVLPESRPTASMIGYHISREPQGSCGNRTNSIHGAS
jgi:hypothetical protein